jgi:small subunit ribosomal protein S16
VEPQREKKNKLDAFNAALAEAGNEPKTSAISTKKSSKETAEPEAAAEPSEA